ncbi:inlA [Symbiodinium natans]|uniref:InlA protein n=1 Tax=Symbiodinium natans TaxID=878477 RepID=A0A812SI17_9DINO|nr:inlA [Symbiodinium natans]
MYSLCLCTDLARGPANSHVGRLLVPLRNCKFLTEIKAVNAGLYGEIPKVQNGEIHLQNLTFKYAAPLQLLDLSSNNITELWGVPVLPRIGRLQLRRNHVLKMRPGLLTEVVNSNIIIDLSETQLANKEEAAQLLARGALTSTAEPALRDEDLGFACKDIIGAVRVTPSKFLPDELCECLPGWHGRGARCQKCPPNTYNEEMGRRECSKCPDSSAAPEGSAKEADCQCAFGHLHHGKCECDQHEALQNATCTVCSKLHLNCSDKGSIASTAVPQLGYARLEALAEEARKCLPPAEGERCPGSQRCGAGYTGTLCSSCNDRFWARRGRCEPCAETSTTWIWSLGLLGVATLILGAFLVYRKMHEVQAKSLALRLIALQGPVLLQTAQLWGVLSRLGRAPSTQRQVEIPYLEGLQLTATQLQNSLNLQCNFHADTIRTLSALTSPLVPLVLLACCAALEPFQAGLGVSLAERVSMALKTLTFLFIGGASATAQLLSCQSTDGDGESLGDFAFRKSFQKLRCNDSSGLGVDVVGYSAAAAYGILIPLFLVPGLRV